MRNKLLIVFVVIIIIECVTSHYVSHESDRGIISRKKRFLLFPEGSNYIQLIIGIGIPLELKSTAVVFGWAYRAVYNLPSNLSQLMPMDQNTRRKRSVSRWDIYKLLEKMSETKGLGGRSCILRAICEASDVPLDKYNGLFEEILHSVFTPSTTDEDVHHHADNEYYAAQKLGKTYRGQCRQVFPDCKMSIMDIFTRLASDFNV